MTKDKEAQQDMSGMSRLYRTIARQGVLRIIRFEPVGREVVGIDRDESGHVARRIYPATRQFRPYAGEYECFVLDRKYPSKDGAAIAKAIPVDPFSLSLEEWLPFREYARQLTKRMRFERSNRGEAVTFDEGKLTVLHERSRPVAIGATAMVVILEDLWVDRAYAIGEAEAAQLATSSATSIVKLFEAAGLMSDAEKEYVLEETIDVKAELKARGVRVADIKSDEQLTVVKRRVHVWRALSDEKLVGTGNTVSITDSPETIRAACKRILAAVHPDRADAHPLVSVFGGMRKAPYFVRRRAEARFTLLREVVKATLSILNGWQRVAKAEEEARKPRKPQGVRARRAAQAAMPAVTVTEQKAPEAVAAPREEAQAPKRRQTQPMVPATEAASSATEGVDLATQLAAVETTLADPDLLPNKRRFFDRERVRLLAALKAAASPKAEKATKSVEERAPTLKGFQALGALITATSDGELD